MSPFSQIYTAFKNRRRRDESGFALLDIIICLAIIMTLAAAGIIAFQAIKRNAEEQSLARVAEKTAEPSPIISVPAVDSAPVDLTIFWTVLSVIGGILILGAVVAVLVMVIRKAKISGLEMRKRQEAAEEERREALAVWGKFTSIHGELKDKALEVETDWDMLFSYPALVDPSVPQTRAFHSALKAADLASPKPPADLNLSMNISGLEYPRLVSTADEAWQAAWSFAKKTGLKLIPREERKKIDQITKLLKLARDGGGSEHERSVAYERAAKLIGELHFVRVPEVALKAIGAEKRLVLEALGARTTVG